MDPAVFAALRDKMLDAAEVVVVRQGIANLTLEAVAAEAGLSKGGLLHHFPSKDRLVEAMVARCAEHWRRCSAEAYERAPAGPGRMARALLSQLEDQDSWTDQCQRGSCAVFAALAQNPSLIEPMREVYGELRARLTRDGLAPGVGETVIAAMDGLWLYRVLGLTRVDKPLLDMVRRVLEPMLATAAAGPHAPSAPAAASRRGEGGRTNGKRGGERAKAGKTRAGSKTIAPSGGGAGRGGVNAGSKRRRSS